MWETTGVREGGRWLLFRGGSEGQTRTGIARPSGHRRREGRDDAWKAGRSLALSGHEGEGGSFSTWRVTRRRQRGRPARAAVNAFPRPLPPAPTGLRNGKSGETGLFSGNADRLLARGAGDTASVSPHLGQTPQEQKL